MELTGSYRHELKYQISPADALALRQRLRAVMKRDPHTGADGLYTIRSVYFDNYGDKALREKVNGVQKREKFRIRYYNDDFSFITLEKKIKHNDLCMKIDAPLTVEEYRRILREPGPWMLGHPDGLVRVTFDSHIRTSLFQRDFSDGAISDICATDAPGDVILEIKFDAFLPEIIRCLLQSEELRQQAFSKYGSCRRFG